MEFERRQGDKTTRHSALTRDVGWVCVILVELGNRLKAAFLDDLHQVGLQQASELVILKVQENHTERLRVAVVLV